MNFIIKTMLKTKIEFLNIQRENVLTKNYIYCLRLKKIVMLNFIEAGFFNQYFAQQK